MIKVGNALFFLAYLPPCGILGDKLYYNFTHKERPERGPRPCFFRVKYHSKPSHVQAVNHVGRDAAAPAALASTSSTISSYSSQRSTSSTLLPTIGQKQGRTVRGEQACQMCIRTYFIKNFYVGYLYAVPALSASFYSNKS